MEENKIIIGVMDKNHIMISSDEYSELLYFKSLIDVIERMVVSDDYISSSTLKAILNIEGGKENESV